MGHSWWVSVTELSLVSFACQNLTCGLCMDTFAVAPFKGPWHHQSALPHLEKLQHATLPGRGRFTFQDAAFGLAKRSHQEAGRHTSNHCAYLVVALQGPESAGSEICIIKKSCSGHKLCITADKGLDAGKYKMWSVTWCWTAILISMKYRLVA